MSIDKKSPTTDSLQENDKVSLQRLNKLMTSPEFLGKVQAVKMHIAMGRSLDEARYKAGIEKGYEWRDVMNCLGTLTRSKEKIYLEYYLRTQLRYQQAMDLLERSKKVNDFDMEAKMILTLTKIDRDFIEVAEKLGLLKDDDGDAPDERGRIAKERIKFYQDRLRAMVNALDGADMPITVDVQPQPNDERPADNMGSIPVDKDTAAG